MRSHRSQTAFKLERTGGRGGPRAHRSMPARVRSASRRGGGISMWTGNKSGQVNEHADLCDSTVQREPYKRAPRWRHEMAHSIVTASALDVRVRNGEAARAHIEAEIADNVDGIMATLVPHEPYAYTVIPIGHPAGSIPHQKFVSSRADLRTSYETLHRFAASCPMQSIAEIRGDWYVFLHGVAEGRLK